jgi:hypothetical protein
MKPITAGSILLASLAAATQPDVLFAGTVNIPKVSVPHINVAHLTTPQANTQNVTSTNGIYLRIQLNSVTVAPVRWGSNGGAPAGGGGGAGKVHTLNPNATVIHQ